MIFQKKKTKTKQKNKKNKNQKTYFWRIGSCTFNTDMSLRLNETDGEYLYGYNL